MDGHSPDPYDELPMGSVADEVYPDYDWNQERHDPYFVKPPSSLENPTSIEQEPLDARLAYSDLQHPLIPYQHQQPQSNSFRQGNTHPALAPSGDEQQMNHSSTYPRYSPNFATSGAYLPQQSTTHVPWQRLASDGSAHHAGLGGLAGSNAARITGNQDTHDKATAIEERSASLRVSM